MHQELDCQMPLFIPSNIQRNSHPEQLVGWKFWAQRHLNSRCQNWPVFPVHNLGLKQKVYWLIFWYCSSTIWRIPLSPSLLIISFTLSNLVQMKENACVFFCKCHLSNKSMISLYLCLSNIAAVHMAAVKVHNRRCSFITIKRQPILQIEPNLINYKISWTAQT